MSYFVAALAAPIIGPILYGVLHGRDRAVRLVDGFVYIAVPALVAWQVVPFALERRTLLAPLAVVAGLLVPTVFERLSHALEALTDDLAIVVGLSGLVLHAFLEGAAFASPESIEPAFGLAVTLHRVPVALVIWWLVRPRHGPVAASAGVGVLVLATVGGWALGHELLGPAHGSGIELYQAFVSGSLIHVVFHQGRHDHRHHHHGHTDAQDDHG